VRRVKSDAKVGMRAEVATATLAGAEAQLALVRTAEADLLATGRIARLAYTALEPGSPLEVRDVALAPAS